jgi:hypothetical protein
VVLADLLDEVILVHRLCVVIDLPAIGLKGFDGVCANIF